MLVAAIQLSSKANKKKNLAVATALMTRAVRMGAKLIALPECFAIMGSKTELYKEAETLTDSGGKGLAFSTMQEFAQKNKVFVLAGSIPMLFKKEERLTNRSILFGPDGKILGKYDKIHLFDADLKDVRSYRESETFSPGSEIIVSDTPFGKVGLSICYDLRFPEVYRTLTLRGARLIFVPSAFTMYTGKDHWLALLKARAIENQVYIVAPAQFGKHSAHQTSFGKSCIIDPWGNIIALAPDCETAIVAEIDFKFLEKVRKELPVLKHYRKDLFSLGLVQK